VQAVRKNKVNEKINIPHNPPSMGDFLDIMDNLDIMDKKLQIANCKFEITANCKLITDY